MAEYEEERIESVDALIRFHERFEADRARGDVRGLMHYLGMYPGHEESIGREYYRLVDLARKERARSAGSDLLDSRFRLDRVLGKGGQGEVWLARDTVLGRPVALKLGGPSFGAGTDRSRLEREARVAASVEDPRICKIHGVGVADGHSYIVMEYVAGTTLADSFSARQSPFGSSDPVDVLHVAKLFREIAAAVGLAHARGIIHRDLKPSNVIRKADGSPVILDFGLARIIDDRDRMTLTGDVIGTPGYMSPEQIDGRNRIVGPHSDVFALGVMLCEALSLRHPFEAPSDVERRARVVRGDFIAVRNLAPWVPPLLATIVETAIEHDPARRYSDASRLFADLTAYLENRPISARPVSTLRRAAMFARRNRSRIARVGAALVIAALVFAFFDASRRTDVERGRRQLEELGARLDAVHREYDELWPRDDASVDVMQRWCDEVAELRTELPRLVRRRDELRAEFAMPASVEDERSRIGAIEASIVALEAELEALESQLAIFDGWPDSDDRPYSPKARLEADRARLRQRIDALEREKASPRVSWRFEDDDCAAEHDAICDRIARIEALDWEGSTDANVIAMTKRLAWTRDLAARRSGTDREIWSAVIEEIRDPTKNPVYRGLEIVPQFGLVPLGKDEESGMFEFAHLPSGRAWDPPVATASGRLKRKFDDARPWSSGIVFVLVPGGEFRMGQAREETGPLLTLDWKEHETPVHRVELDAFFIAKHELAQEQWVAFVGGNRSTYEIGKPVPPDGSIALFGLPVETVRFDEVRTVLGRFGLDLPTEAQWEYAARGGAIGKWFAYGENRESFASGENVADRSYFAVQGMAKEREDTMIGDPYPLTAPIYAGKVNGFGLVNCGGNVFEMCRDGYRLYHFPIVDREGLRGIVEEDVVIRGGSFETAFWATRVAHRDSMPRDQLRRDVGLRPIRRLER